MAKSAVDPQADHPLFLWCNDFLQLKSPFNLYVEIKFQGNVD